MQAAERLDPPASARLRAANVDDVPLILQLIRELAAYEKLAHEVVATEAGLRESLFGKRPAAEVQLAFCGEEAAGFCLFFSNYSTFLGRAGLYIEDLYVKPEFRGQGIGKTLFSTVTHLAHERGCGRVEWAVLDWNKDAVRFYESLGAKPMNEWIVYRLTNDDPNPDERMSRASDHRDSARRLIEKS